MDFPTGPGYNEQNAAPVFRPADKIKLIFSEPDT